MVIDGQQILFGSFNERMYAAECGARCGDDMAAAVVEAVVLAV